MPVTPSVTLVRPARICPRLGNSNRFVNKWLEFVRPLNGSKQCFYWILCDTEVWKNYLVSTPHGSWAHEVVQETGASAWTSLIKSSRDGQHSWTRWPMSVSEDAPGSSTVPSEQCPERICGISTGCFWETLAGSRLVVFDNFLLALVTRELKQIAVEPILEVTIFRKIRPNSEDFCRNFSLTIFWFFNRDTDIISNSYQWYVVLNGTVFFFFLDGLVLFTVVSR